MRCACVTNVTRWKSLPRWPVVSAPSQFQSGSAIVNPVELVSLHFFFFFFLLSTFCSHVVHCSLSLALLSAYATPLQPPAKTTSLTSIFLPHSLADSDLPNAEVKDVTLTDSKCNYCGARQHIEDFTICEQCGASHAEDSAETLSCPLCGGEQDVHAAFCTDCGFSLRPGKIVASTCSLSPCVILCLPLSHSFALPS